MKKIKVEDIKVNDWLYIIDETNPKRTDSRIFVLKVLTNRGEIIDTYFWNLHKEGKKKWDFKAIKHKGSYLMEKHTWEYYNIFRLNKKEIGNFKKILILNEL